MQFTPQYGDSFVEVVRLQVLEALELALSNDATQQQIDSYPGNTDAKVSKDQLVRAIDVHAVALLDLKCANADPNYGLVWFECRQASTDTAQMILARARARLINDIHAHQGVYTTALARWRGVTDAHLFPRDLKATLESNPLLKYANRDFTTALIEFNRLELCKCDNRRKFQALFGSDILIP